MLLSDLQDKIGLIADGAISIAAIILSIKTGLDLKRNKSESKPKEIESKPKVDVKLKGGEKG